MKVTNKAAYAIALVTSLIAGQSTAASWKDQLSSAANELSKSSTTATGSSQASGSSLSSLTNLLGGGNKALSSNSMTNAAGILEYCTKNKLVSGSKAGQITNQLLSKLGMSNSTSQNQQQDYTQGIMGLLNTGKGEQINLNSIGNTPIAQQVKTKACDLVLKQGAKYLSL